ncbi:MAG: cell division protein ZapD [Cocleimonas sp.]
MTKYEQPLNEKIRLFMRLSYLMKRFNTHLDEPTSVNCQAAIMVLLELYNLSSRLDVKNAALYVLDIQALNVRKAEEKEGVDDAKASRILEKLEEKSKRLYSFRGQLGQQLKSHNFLNILKQRATIAGGINDLDIPLFNYWLNKPEEERVEDLRGWAKPYEIAFEAIELLMELIYQGYEETEEVANGGFYQASLSPDKNYQILSINLPKNSKLYPEISAGKQRFSIRFVDGSNLEEKGKQIVEAVDFTLTLYSF